MGYPYIKISALKWCPKTCRNNVQSGLVTCNGCGIKGVRVNWQESWFSPETMPYKCKAQYYFELNFNPREKWSRLNIPMIHNNNLLHFTATYT